MYNRPFHTTNISESRFLITGGAGFIGSNLAEYLLKYKAGHVRVLDNFSTGKRKNLEAFSDNPAFELMEGDIRDPEVCRKAMENIDYVSHQAALGSVPRSVKDPVTTNAVNISGFLNVLVAAKDAAVKRMIYAASSSTYGDSKELPKVEERIGKPLSPYAVTKYVNELYADVFSKLYGFHTVGLRYFNVYGPRQDPYGAYAAVIPLFMKALLAEEAPVINGDGEQTRDFTFVENAVQANIKAMLVPSLSQQEVVNIAVGERTSLNMLWDRICELGNIDIKPRYGESRTGDVRDSLANVAKASELIGYNPEVKIAEGLKITLDWYHNNLTDVLQ